MKRLLKRVLKAVWRKTAILRGPITRKLDQHINGLMTQSIQAQLPPALSRIEHAVNVMAFDTNLVLNSVVREVARLQMQVEVLQQLIQDCAPAQGGLSLVGQPDIDGTGESDSGDLMRVG
jgi:hypothetical protein